MNDAFPDHAAGVLAAARILVAAWLVLAAAHRLVDGRTLAPWGRWSRVGPWWVRLGFAGQGGLALWMAATSSIGVAVGCLAVLLATYAALLFATGIFWADGSDKMGVIALAGTLLIAVGVWLGDPALGAAGALLTGGQLALCYAVAGISKIPHRGWRDGSELAKVMASRSYGHAGLAGLLRRGSLAAVASWIVIVAETAFPLMLLAPEPWLVGALATLFLFHVGTAVFMGLNRFPWAYAAAYPAVLLLGRIVRELVA